MAGPNFQLGLPQSGILTIQPDRLFSESAFGKRVEREIEAEGAVLTAENRRIEAELRTGGTGADRTAQRGWSRKRSVLWPMPLMRKCRKPAAARTRNCGR